MTNTTRPLRALGALTLAACLGMVAAPEAAGQGRVKKKARTTSPSTPRIDTQALTPLETTRALQASPPTTPTALRDRLLTLRPDLELIPKAVPSRATAGLFERLHAPVHLRGRRSPSGRVTRIDVGVTDDVGDWRGWTSLTSHQLEQGDPKVTLSVFVEPHPEPVIIAFRTTNERNLIWSDGEEACELLAMPRRSD
jgi:hypothetical protein